MVRIFSTCVQSTVATPDRYVAQVAEIARWVEEVGFEGTLIYPCETTTISTVVVATGGAG